MCAFTLGSCYLYTLACIKPGFPQCRALFMGLHIDKPYKYDGFMELNIELDKMF